MDSTQLVQQWMKEIFQTSLTDEERKYIAHSWPRYEFVLKQVEKYAEQIGSTVNSSDLSLLDVGPHYFTTLLRRRFPNATINTLGYDNHKICPASIIQNHCAFDLNSAQNKNEWPKFQEHHIVIMGEVIEHLYTAPSLVLQFIKTLIAQNGFLILSTPNAVTITKRIALSLGKNPFEMIRETHDNPGHFREYTKAELIDIGKKAGLKVCQISLENYFYNDNKMINLLYKLTSFLPQFRNGITITYKK